MSRRKKRALTGVLLLLILPNFMGITSTWLSVPLSQAFLAVAALLLILLYDRKQRKRESIVSEI